MRPFHDYPYFCGGAFLPFAHRGGARRFPENTAYAFEAAQRLGFRHIETDVQLTADGQIVVFHDDTLERTTNGQGRIAHHNLESLLSLDAGYGFSNASGDYPYRDRDLRIPTLRSILRDFPDLYLNLEMKGTDLRLPTKLYTLLTNLGVQDRVLVASANDTLTARFRQHDRIGQFATSPGARGILRFWSAVRLGVHRQLSHPFQVLQVPIHHGVLPVITPPFVRAAHERGIAVHAWTIDDPLQMRWLQQLGVNGIMSDLPEVLQQTLLPA